MIWSELWNVNITGGKNWGITRGIVKSPYVYKGLTNYCQSRKSMKLIDRLMDCCYFMSLVRFV